MKVSDISGLSLCFFLNFITTALPLLLVWNVEAKAVITINHWFPATFLRLCSHLSWSLVYPFSEFDAIKKHRLEYVFNFTPIASDKR